MYLNDFLHVTVFNSILYWLIFANHVLFTIFLANSRKHFIVQKKIGIKLAFKS